MKRFCPSENILSEYLSGTLKGKRRQETEKHISNCEKCRETLKDAYIVTQKKGLVETLLRKAHSLSRHFWISLSMLSLAMSFYQKNYFFQFIALSLIFSFMWKSKKQAINNQISFSSSKIIAHNEKEKKHLN